MGYYTTVSGEIAINPPLTNAEIKDSPFVPRPGSRWSERDLNLLVIETQVETDDGTLIRRIATAVIPASEDEYKSYNIVEHLQELVSAFGDDHTFTGYLEGVGEENGDIWRLTVRDGKAVKVKARIVWDS